jgi:transcriptional regulator with XRE-family HTH domain
MNNIGNILAHLRKLKHLTQSEVAAALKISVKSISRYETNQSKPTGAILESLLKFYGYEIFDIYESANQDIYKLKHELLSNYGAELLNDYNKCQNNKTLAGYDYFWINKYGESIGGQTKFVDFCNNDKNKEIRTLRLVNPNEAIKSCERIFKKKPIVINEKMDVLIFEYIGGEAIVRKDICNDYLPEYLDDFITENHD